jgi:acyl-CoA dehydrogenase
MISFQPTEEQQLVIDTVREFALEQLRPGAHEAEEKRMLSQAHLRSGRELGLIPANLPEKYGGFGEEHSALLGVLFAEELGYGELSSAIQLLAPASVATPILHFGTEEQKEEYLPRFAVDEFFASAALVEPVWNFDPAALKTVAQRSNGRYVITGRKSYVVLDDKIENHLLLLYALDESAGTTQAFLVERSAPGIRVEERERGMGLGALRYHQVTFDEVEVAAGARLGGEGDGIEIGSLLNYARVASAALATGLARGSYEFAQAYAMEREAFGKPVAQFQAIAFMLAEMRIAVESMRLLAWETAWQLDQGMDATRAAVLAHQYSAEYALQVADRAVQVLGGHGYIREYPVERWLREARLFGSVEGLVMV